MAICLRAREEFADNRFQLLFIYIDTSRGSPPSASFHCYGAPYKKRNTHDGIPLMALPQ